MPVPVYLIKHEDGRLTCGTNSLDILLRNLRMAENCPTHHLEKMQVLSWDDPSTCYSRRADEFMFIHRYEPQEVARSEAPEVDTSAYERHIKDYRRISWNPISQVFITWKPEENIPENVHLQTQPEMYGNILIGLRSAVARTTWVAGGNEEWYWLTFIPDGVFN